MMMMMIVTMYNDNDNIRVLNSVILFVSLILIIISRVSNDVTLSLNTARQHGIEKCVEKMLNFAEQLRRLKVGLTFYVSLSISFALLF